MKRIYCLFVGLVSVALGLSAQTQTRLVFYHNGEKVFETDAMKVDSIVFADNRPTPEDPGEPEIPAEETVDLGLSVEWASYNLGAEKPEDYGYYLAYGEYEPKEYYYPENYTFYLESLNMDIAGTEYDCAKKLWGDGWRMPTLEQCKELVEKCTWKWDSRNGVNGLTVTGPSGKSIFLPAGGYYNWSGLVNEGSYGTYWTGTSAGDMESCYFRFDSGMFEGTSWDGAKYVGQLVRPVRAKTAKAMHTPVPDDKE